MTMTLVRAENLVVDFPIYGSRSRSLKNTLVRAATGGNLVRGAGEKIVVRALDHVSFDLHEGDRVALIGHNGSGKSTLLRVLAGAYEPVSGELAVNGRVASMLSLSIGTDTEATGRENIRLLSVLFGLSDTEIERKTQEIEAFTELGAYLDMPLRTYSSGMALRLGFAVATSVDAEIILMDEWVSVGDALFVEKADQRLHEFVERAGLLVLASHTPDLLRKICNKAMLLEHGKVLAFGPLEEVLAIYDPGEKALPNV